MNVNTLPRPPSSVVDAFRAATSAWPSVGEVWIGYSGGADSTALLLAARVLGLPNGARLCAVHVNHGLHGDARAWARHCVRVCEALDVPLTVRNVDVPSIGGGGPEARARTARRTVFEEMVDTHQLLCTAHHLEDQAETVLLRLARGAGIDGLGGIAPLGRLGDGWIARPLLAADRESLRRWVNSCGVEVIEDPSNQDERLDRVFVRKRILPLLRERWPAVDATLARNAGLARATARQQHLLTQPAGRRYPHSCRDLMALGVDERRLAVRGWFAAHDGITPSYAQTEQVLDQMLGAGADRMPEVRVGALVVRRYRGEIHIGPAQLPLAPAAPVPVGFDTALPVAMGILRMSVCPGKGLAQRWLEADSTSLGYRAGGESCELTAAGRRGTLKHLMQGWGIAPWLRPLHPLIMVGGDIAVVPGHFTAPAYRAHAGEEGVVMRWDCAAPALQDERV